NGPYGAAESRRREGTAPTLMSAEHGGATGGEKGPDARRRPKTGRSPSTLSAPGEGANEADGPLSASAWRVENRRQGREEKGEQPYWQSARELVAGGFGAWDVGGKVAEEAVVDLEDERGRAVD